MKDHIGNILDEYIKGNQTRRLHLFLTHRDLRRQFMDLEKKEKLMSQKDPQTSAKSAGTYRTLFRRLATALNILISS
jgi:hypothetical protein